MCYQSRACILAVYILAQVDTCSIDTLSVITGNLSVIAVNVGVVNRLNWQVLHD
jgi:hypothetical protein